MKVAVVEELLARTGKARSIATADEAGKRLLPVQSEPFELLQERLID
jgi:hypothetical protein